MNPSRRQSALLLALGLVLVASPVTPGGAASIAPSSARISLDLLLTATARSTCEKQAVEALVAGLRDTVRFFKHKPRPAGAALVQPRLDEPGLVEQREGLDRFTYDDTHRLVALMDGRLNLPPPLV